MSIECDQKPLPINSSIEGQILLRKGTYLYNAFLATSAVTNNRAKYESDKLAEHGSTCVAGPTDIDHFL